MSVKEQSAYEAHTNAVVIGLVVVIVVAILFLLADVAVAPAKTTATVTPVGMVYPPQSQTVHGSTATPGIIITLEPERVATPSQQ